MTSRKFSWKTTFAHFSSWSSIKKKNSTQDKNKENKLKIFIWKQPLPSLITSEPLIIQKSFWKYHSFFRATSCLSLEKNKQNSCSDKQFKISTWHSCEKKLSIETCMNMHNMCQDNLCFKWSCQTLYTNEQIDYIWIKSLNPLHPNISMHILLTVLYTFSKVLARRICLTIKRFFN